jgi:hypothetical protein
LDTLRRELGPIVVLALTLVLAGGADPGGAAIGATTAGTGVPVSSALASVGNGSSPFGVNASAGRRPDAIGYLTDLGARWVRVNSHLDGHDPNFAAFLEAGLDLIITFNNADPSNINTAYGTLAEWPNAGFPFTSKAAYQQRIRDSLAPVIPFLAAGRQVWVQCENEVGDASLNPTSRYWRGTTDQYLIQLQVLYEVVRTISPAIPVVLTSFASESLDAVLDPSDPHYGYATAHLTTLLAQEQYDAADLHFYGCVENISAKAESVRDRLPAAKRWIATENSGPDSRCPTTPISWRQNLALFEQIEAQQVPARLIACAENGGSICLWFSLFDLASEPSDVFNHLGLLDPRVIPPRKKPAYDAFRAFTSVLPLTLNQANFRLRDTLILHAIVTPGPTPVMADVYVAVLLPAGSLLFLQADGSLTSALLPILRRWQISPFAGQIFAYTFSGGESVGTYAWLAAFTEPGTLNFIGPVVAAPFGFGP